MKINEFIKQLSVLSVYIFLSIIMTYPLILKINTSISEAAYGDPLLNTWILAWDVHKILELDLSCFFDANIFYPHKNTFAYSEHLIGSAIFALPIIVFFKNSILAYNIILLMGFSLSGFGMYLLAYYLTGSKPASFCAGLIFAFFPWRFGHIGHFQAQTAQWIPLTFLYLHKFTDNGKNRHLLLFTLFFILQFLSNGYYAMFLSFFVGIMLVMEIYKRGCSDRHFLYKIGLFFLISAVCILPVFYPYIKVKHEMGFTRSVGEAVMFSADILSYLAAPYFNIPWGWITKIFWKPEGDLFLGLTAMSLAIVGIISQRTKIIAAVSSKIRHEKSKAVSFLSGVITFISALVLCEILLVLITGGLNFTIMGIKVRSTRIHNPLTILFILVLVRLLIEQKFRKFIKSVYFSMGNHRVRFYFMVLVLSFIFSLGPIIHFNGKEIMYAPYFILRLLPGFDGLRVPARFIIIVALSVSIFASFGVLTILKRFSVLWKRAIVTVIIVLLLLFESFSTIPTPSVAVGNDIPEVYKWLGREKGDFAILEMPLPRNHEEASKETIYLYYSTYHWKKLVNGYSGYFPPAYTFLIYEGMRDFPSPVAIGLLEELNVKYLIIHSLDFKQEEWERIKRGLQNYKSILSPFKQFGDVYVYERIGVDRTVNNSKEIPREKWLVRANIEKPESAIDGNIKTRWTTGRPQQSGDFFEIDIGELRTISKVVFELGDDFRDYPRGYRIEISKDARDWEEIKREDLAIPPISSFAKHPKRIEFEISFSPSTARFIRITQTGSHPDYYWSIREIRLFE